MVHANSLASNVAVIGFSGASSPLEPVWPSTHRALLPIVGKAVIIHLIEQLAAAGIKHLRIAGSIQQFAVKARVGSGKEWDVTVRYSDLHGPDLCMQTLLEKGDCLYIPGDQMIRLNQSSLSSADTKTFSIEQSQFETPAYWKLSAGEIKRNKLEILGSGNEGFLLNTSEFHYINMLVGSGNADGYSLPGRAISPKVHVGWDSRINKRAKLYANVTIGNQCYISEDVILNSGCVIGDGSVISNGSQLSNVTVLPNCFVGSKTQIRDAVITPSCIFDLRGRCWPVHDPSVISRTRSNQESSTGHPEESMSELERNRQTQKTSKWVSQN